MSIDTDKTTAEPIPIPVLSQKAIETAAQCWCDPRTSGTEMDADLFTVFAEVIERYRDALMWCSGSADFGPGGKACEGWNKIARPLI